MYHEKFHIPPQFLFKTIGAGTGAFILPYVSGSPVIKGPKGITP